MKNTNNDIIISKEFISTVLPDKIIDKAYFKGDKLWFRTIKPSMSIRWDDFCINTSDFIKECKKWLWKKHEVYISTDISFRRNIGFDFNLKGANLDTLHIYNYSIDIDDEKVDIKDIWDFEPKYILRVYQEIFNMGEI